MPAAPDWPTATLLPLPSVRPAPTATALPPTAIANPAPLTPQRPQTGELAEVLRVVDGDTIIVLVGRQIQRVRYIGVNAPESVKPDSPVEYMGPEASAANERLVGGKWVLLERDVSETDRYGRLLRYVWVDDTMVNAELVRQGYAHAVSYPPDVKHLAWLRSLEAQARAAGRGLWR